MTQLTSSNFAAAIGLSRFMSRQKLWRVLTGREQREPMNEFMQHGIDNEFRAVCAAEIISGMLFFNTGEDQKHYKLDNFGTTPDGDCGPIGLEVKCPQVLRDEPPDYYLPQVQGQCWIAGFEQVVFCQWTHDESRAWMIERNDAYIEKMHSLLNEFMTYVLADEQPKRKKKPVLPQLTITRI